jgi:predicted HAD superfamily phosphohydrolase YqeG
VDYRIKSSWITGLKARGLAVFVISNACERSRDPSSLRSVGMTS